MPVDEKAEPREVNWRQLLPWTILFQGFRVALDPNKLLLAAAGLLTMSFLWWLTSVVFDYERPKWSDYQASEDKSLPETEARNEAWKKYKIDLAKWKVMHKAAGSTSKEDYYGVDDFADSWTEHETILPDALKNKDIPPVPPDVKTIAQIEQMEKDGKIDDKLKAKVWKIRLQEPRPAGQLRSLPWSEDRGPNPYMLATGQAPRWEKGHFLEWLVTEQVPVLLEPLFKLFRPLVFFFDSKAGGLTRFYCILLLLWTILVWGLFGGAITRIAAVQVTRQEKVGLVEALRFTAKRYVSYISAPILPLIAVGILVIIMILFGLFQMIPVVGEILDALFWWLMILFGLGMAVVLVGMVGWPLMSATISTEGTDSWEAVSRSYSYVYQAPWHYIWYTLVAIAYGAVIIFFVGFMGSFMVYLSKWGVSQTPGIDAVNRNPSYLFAYAPKSFGWRELLLQGATVEGQQVVVNGEIDDKAYDKLVDRDPNYNGKDKMTLYNKAGAVAVSIVWIGLIFMLVVGFGYSYFWSSSTIIYLLMRRKVDDAELDEVYLEEEEPYSGPLAGESKPPEPTPGPSTGIRPTATSPIAGPASLPMVDAPRPAAVPATPPVAEVPRPSAVPPPIYTPQPVTPAPTPASEPLHSEPSGHVPEPPTPLPEPPSPPGSEGPTAPSGNGES